MRTNYKNNYHETSPALVCTNLHSLKLNPTNKHYHYDDDSIKKKIHTQNDRTELLQTFHHLSPSRNSTRVAIGRYRKNRTPDSIQGRPRGVGQRFEKSGPGLIVPRFTLIFISNGRKFYGSFALFTCVGSYARFYDDPTHFATHQPYTQGHPFCVVQVDRIIFVYYLYFYFKKFLLKKMVDICIFLFFVNDQLFILIIFF